MMEKRQASRSQQHTDRIWLHVLCGSCEACEACVILSPKRSSIATRGAWRRRSPGLGLVGSAISLHLEGAPCNVTRLPGKCQPWQTRPPQSTERQLRISAGCHRGSELHPASQAGSSEGGKGRGWEGVGHFSQPSQVAQVHVPSLCTPRSSAC